MILSRGAAIEMLTGQVRIADNPLAASLESLVAQPYSWTPETWRRLATSPHLTNLTDFSVAYSVDLAATLGATPRERAQLNPWARKALAR